jgi:3-oxoadipate enol-lactonase
VLFIAGEHDRITSPALIREAHALVAGSEFHEILGAGHNAYFERPREWNRVVRDFLGQAEMAGR